MGQSVWGPERVWIKKERKKKETHDVSRFGSGIRWVQVQEAG